MQVFYGASVKKIQAYITQTNKLREIAGASELVQYVCTQCFQEFCEGQGIASADVDIIIQAAGNIRAVFRNRADAAKVMLAFPKLVAETAPGLQFIQATLDLDHDHPTYDDVQALEARLREQLPIPAVLADWSVTRKCPRTGVPAVATHDGKPIDAATRAKLDHAESHFLALKLKLDETRRFPDDISRIAGANSFVAVIHADGNNLGQTLMRLKDSPTYHNDWKGFSLKLDDATVGAACAAYQRHFGEQRDNRFRPIILGGDDLTVVCAPDKAIAFTRTYLDEFARRAREHGLGDLTACAGIAFVKQNFPFYYSLDMAEFLCGAAKKRAKAVSMTPVPSSFLFASELGSFVDDSYTAYRKRLLDTPDGHTFAFGPYATQPGTGLPCIDDLLALADFTHAYTPIRSGVRKLISVVRSSQSDAALYADRLEQLAKDRQRDWSDGFLKPLAALTGQPATSFRDALFNADGASPILDLLTCLHFSSESENAKETND
ncbi:MAG: Cas10/Cmr2 second palm domain-containing protein [Oligosphaeraceae bacterium]